MEEEHIVTGDGIHNGSELEPLLARRQLTYLNFRFGREQKDTGLGLRWVCARCFQILLLFAWIMGTSGVELHPSRSSWRSLYLPSLFRVIRIFI